MKNSNRRNDMLATESEAPQQPSDAPNPSLNNTKEEITNDK